MTGIRPIILLISASLTVAATAQSSTNQKHTNLDLTARFANLDSQDLSGTVRLLGSVSNVSASAGGSDLAMRLHLHGPAGGVQTLVDDLRQAIAATGSPSQEEAKARIEQLSADIEPLKLKLDEVTSLAGEHTRALREIAQEEMKSLELQRQALEMDLAAKSARARAIEEQIAKASKASTRAAASDAVIEELARSIKIREKARELVRTQYERGLASQTDVVKAEEALIEARTRVAEREQAQARSSSADLLARLGEELAIVSIDQAELLARLKVVTQYLPPGDFTKLQEDDLRRLRDHYNVSSPGYPTWFGDIQKQLRPLLLQKLALMISDLRPDASRPPG